VTADDDKSSYEHGSVWRKDVSSAMKRTNFETYEDARSPTVDICEKLRRFEKNHIMSAIPTAQTSVVSFPPRIV
jgi:hypothetical protein